MTCCNLKIALKARFILEVTICRVGECVKRMLSSSEHSRVELNQLLDLQILLSHFTAKQLLHLEKEVAQKLSLPESELCLSETSSL